MNVIAVSQMNVIIQLNVFEAIMDLLLVNPVFLLGIVFIGIALIILFRKNGTIPKFRTSIASFVMYYYLCIMLSHVVGIPTLYEYIRLTRLGESFFNPNISLVPFCDGFSLSFILNIFLFIPLGFLCPLISKTFERAKNTFFIGLGLSLFIEIAQLFTLYRATDINDLLTNVIGTLIGYLFFRLVEELRLVKLYSNPECKEKDYTVYMPIVIIMIACILGFFS